MPWSNRTPEQNARYWTPEHRAYLAALKAQLLERGWLDCTADECLMPTRRITNPNGRAPDGLQAGHEPDGVTYRGPQHGRCNHHEASVRGNQARRRLARWVL